MKACILAVRGFEPQIPNSAFIAPNATIVGNVKLGENTSVWFNAVIRGDVCRIEIGDHSNIQDGVVLHGTYQKADLIIGNKVSIGHNACVHGCTIEDNVLIGMNAVVMDGVHIESNVVVAAGAVVLQNSRLVSGFIYAGIPAKKIKPIGELSEVIERTSRNYPKYASWFNEDLN